MHGGLVVGEGGGKKELTRERERSMGNADEVIESNAMAAGELGNGVCYFRQSTGFSSDTWLCSLLVVFIWDHVAMF
jgi:hypothetical protein